MDTNRLDKMEEMLSTLIKMVGNLNDNQNGMNARIDKLDSRMEKLQQDQNSMRVEIMAKLSDMQADQDHIWGKAARNERELAKIKSHLQL